MTAVKKFQIGADRQFVTMSNVTVTQTPGPQCLCFLVDNQPRHNQNEYFCEYCFVLKVYYNSTIEIIEVLKAYCQQLRCTLPLSHKKICVTEKDGTTELLAGLQKLELNNYPLQLFM